jgi:hypothetical protein
VLFLRVVSDPLGQPLIVQRSEFDGARPGAQLLVPFLRFPRGRDHDQHEIGRRLREVALESAARLLLHRLHIAQDDDAPRRHHRGSAKQ